MKHVKLRQLQHEHYSRVCWMGPVRRFQYEWEMVMKSLKTPSYARPSKEKIAAAVKELGGGGGGNT